MISIRGSSYHFYLAFRPVSLTSNCYEFHIILYLKKLLVKRITIEIGEALSSIGKVTSSIGEAMSLIGEGPESRRNETKQQIQTQIADDVRTLIANRKGGISQGNEI